MIMLRSVNSLAFALALLAPVALASNSGITTSTVAVGQSAPLSGPARQLGEETRAGIEPCFDKVNAAGGVYGRKLKLVSLDVGYDPALARSNTLKLLGQNRVFALLGYVGGDAGIFVSRSAVRG